ncbi:hypothetical protein PAXRUDRAFT_160336 [Paxillus rubicundulus Ve08.2h10]|uniref:Uncharacterized protein n=1 Tax=Paxillus rubicundulus Ve08.2h10 TaxID=930991 RepID=A0A0D0CA47_9AGAM|nr:hypothetical protein PAXRUDRAFT_160336 [Paxillus rubicundulus Ve08.2h10]
MRIHEPDGFALQEPTAKKISRSSLVSLGPHHEWSGDGHDKLNVVGFPIWAARDVFSGKWLGMWVVPNNHCGNTITYLYLSLVHQYGVGMLLQTTQVYGFVNALREYFLPHLLVDELPAHCFLKSVHNITIECGWLPLRQQWGDNVKVFWEAGHEVYNNMDFRQWLLVQWLWPKLIQQELDKLMDTFNNHVVCHNQKKKLPSGVSPNVAFALHAQFGGQDCLQKVNQHVVEQLMEEIGGEGLICFVDVGYVTHAQAIFDSLRFTELTLQNDWAILSAIVLPTLIVKCHGIK